MKVFVYDTETSGLPAFKDLSEAPHQPHICELAALLIDDETMDVIGHVHHLVKQDGWDVGPEAFASHGITKTYSMENGVNEWTAIKSFHDLWKRADIRVGFNVSFDDRIMRIGFKRFGDGVDDGDAHWSQYSREDCDAIADAYKMAPTLCVMRKVDKIVNLAPSEKMVAKGMTAARGFTKQPTLQEAYQHFFGESFDGAHTAVADTIATARLFFHTQGKQFVYAHATGSEA